MRRRPAYTLLEVLLALAIAVLLLGALYTAVGYQLRHAQAGRDLIAQATLSQAVFGRITGDVSATAGLCDPARFRNQNSSTSGGANGASGAAASGTPAASGAATTGAAASATTNSATSTTTNSSTTTADPIVYPGGNGLPLGVIGDSSTLNLFVSRVPGEAWPTPSGDPGALVSDLRRIMYWVTSDGLYRYQVKGITFQDALITDPPTGDLSGYMMAPEVKSVEFSYFDGTNWNDSWDSTLITGADGVTPQGSPRAIAVKVGMAPLGAKDGDKPGELKYYRHVIAITSANGTTPLQQPNPGNPALANTANSTTGAAGTSGTTSPNGN